MSYINYFVKIKNLHQIQNVFDVDCEQKVAIWKDMRPKDVAPIRIGQYILQNNLTKLPIVEKQKICLQFLKENGYTTFLTSNWDNRITFKEINFSEGILKENIKTLDNSLYSIVKTSNKASSYCLPSQHNYIGINHSIYNDKINEVPYLLLKQICEKENVEIVIEINDNGHRILEKITNRSFQSVEFNLKELLNSGLYIEAFNLNLLDELTQQEIILSSVVNYKSIDIDAISIKNVAQMKKTMEEDIFYKELLFNPLLSYISEKLHYKSDSIFEMNEENFWTFLKSFKNSYLLEKKLNDTLIEKQDKKPHKKI